jgi:hypothetical protein
MTCVPKVVLEPPSGIRSASLGRMSGPSVLLCQLQRHIGHARTLCRSTDK